jgi:hypothetical protein
MGRKNRGRKQRVVVKMREAVPERPVEINVEITTEDLRPEAVNSNRANRRRVGKKHCEHVDPRPHRPPESLAKDMRGFGLLLVRKVLDHMLARADSKFAELPRLLSGRCDCPQQRADATMVQRTLTNLGLLAKRIRPVEMTGVPGPTVLESVARSLVRILLLLQTEPTTPRRHCLLCCRNPPVPAPRVCDLARRLGVRITRNGIRTAAVSILPPLRDFDPPMYVNTT